MHNINFNNRYRFQPEVSPPVVFLEGISLLHADLRCFIFLSTVRPNHAISDTLGRAIMRTDIKTLLLVLFALFISAQPSAAWNYNSGAVPPGSKVNVEFKIVFINGEQCTTSTIQSVKERVAKLLGVDAGTVSISACEVCTIGIANAVCVFSRGFLVGFS